MWTKRMLRAYADTVEDKETSERLKAEFEAIQYENGGEVCVAIEGKNAFVRAGVANLYRDLSSKTNQFVTDSDMEALANLR